MPKRLPERWRDESILEFRRAALMRYDDGLSLATQGRRTGAIYMWGYSAEMSLKATYFSLTLAETTPITWSGHLKPAIDQAKTNWGVKWSPQGAGHDVYAWAQLLVHQRNALQNAYPHRIASKIRRCGKQIGELWSVSLRYHDNMAYQHEVFQVRIATEWLLNNLGFL